MERATQKQIPRSSGRRSADRHRNVSSRVLACSRASDPIRAIWQLVVGKNHHDADEDDDGADAEDNEDIQVKKRVIRMRGGESAVHNDSVDQTAMTFMARTVLAMTLTMMMASLDGIQQVVC